MNALIADEEIIPGPKPVIAMPEGGEKPLLSDLDLLRLYLSAQNQHLLNPHFFRLYGHQFQIVAADHPEGSLEIGGIKESAKREGKRLIPRAIIQRFRPLHLFSAQDSGQLEQVALTAGMNID